MANIDEELQNILEASKGEEVRAAIISAIQKIHNEKEYPPNTLKATENRTYTGQVWNKVIVDVPGGIEASVDIDNCNQHITENGYYDIKKLIDEGYIPNPNCVGINGFYVDVDEMAGDLTEINITENGVYDPLLDGYDGYSKVYVNVIGGGNPGQMLTVRFFDYDGTLLYQTQVAYGSDFAYKGSTPNKGGVFTGWNPSIQRITNNQDFYAVYGGTSAGGGRGEITDTWQQIINAMAAKNKSKYMPGQYKTLEITDVGGVKRLLKMMLLGYELDLSNVKGQAFSTWINVNPSVTWAANSIFAPITLAQTLSGDSDSWRNNIGGSNDAPIWNNSLMRAALNGDSSKLIYTPDITYYNALPKFSDMLNAAAGCNLWQSIKKVQKYTSGYRFTSNSGYVAECVINSYTEDKIWIPSWHEFRADCHYEIGSPYIIQSTIGVSYQAIFDAGMRDIWNAYNNSSIQLRDAANNSDNVSVVSGVSNQAVVRTDSYNQHSRLCVSFCL